MSAHVTSRYAGFAWGLDAFFALVVSAPVVAALRAQWPHLGAEALVAPGGLELIETMAERGAVVSSAALVFALLTLARWCAGLLVDVAHAHALGSRCTASALALRMLAVRVVGAVPTGVLLAAAFAPAYAVREAPIASLGTQANVVLVVALALPSLALAFVAMAVERLARGFVAHESLGIVAAWGRAFDALAGGGSSLLRASLAGVVGALVLSGAAALLASVGYGVGIVGAQALLFAGSYLRARVLANAYAGV